MHLNTEEAETIYMNLLMLMNPSPFIIISSVNYTYIKMDGCWPSAFYKFLKILVCKLKKKL